jgi:hypothetical protein
MGVRELATVSDAVDKVRQELLLLSVLLQTFGMVSESA